MSENPVKTVHSAPAENSQPTPDRSTLIAFVSFVLIGGGGALSVRFIYGELEPFWSGVLRFGLAALIFWLLMAIRKVSLPRGRALIGAALFGALSGTALLLMYFGLTKTPASLFQTIAAVLPLLTLVFAAAHKLEPLRRRGVAGGLLAVTGIAIAVSGSLSTGVAVSLPHILAIVAGAACLAEGGIVIKLFPPSHPYATNAIAMTIAASIMVVGSFLLGEAWTLPTLATTWLAMLYVVVGATVGGFLLYLFVLKNWTATGASYGFVLTPIVTVILATLLTDESITLVFLAGAAVVLVGVYIGALLPAIKEPAPPGEQEPIKEDIQVRPALPNCI